MHSLFPGCHRFCPLNGSSAVPERGSPRLTNGSPWLALEPSAQIVSVPGVPFEMLDRDGGPGETLDRERCLARERAGESSSSP